MSDITLTIAGGFANGVGNAMAPSHWTTPLDEIEDFLQARVGRDGVGIDNWSADEALRGLNFRKDGLTQVVRIQNLYNVWSVVPETTGLASAPQGISPSPIPGGSARFYLPWTPNFILVHFSARVGGVGALTDVYQMERVLDGTSTTTGEVRGSISVDADSRIHCHWTATPSNGWHTIQHRVLESGAVSQCVFTQTDLLVLAAYR